MLELSFTAVDEFSAVTIFESLKQNRNLRRLALEGNNCIGASALDSLISLMHLNTTISRVYVRETDIDTAILSELLGRCKRIEVVPDPLADEEDENEDEDNNNHYTETGDVERNDGGESEDDAFDDSDSDSQQEA